jgi:hypothetical protein
MRVGFALESTRTIEITSWQAPPRQRLELSHEEILIRAREIRQLSPL